MAIDINTYYANLETALELTDNAIAKIKPKITDEFDGNTNYSDIMLKLTQFRAQIRRMQAAHKYLKMSQEAFIKRNQESVTKKAEVSHTIKSYETPLGIAQKYGVNLSDILKKNNITTAGMTAGTTIKVELAPAGGINKIYDNIPTYGSQEGDLVLGADLPNSLKATDNGDFKVLDINDTISQGVKNRTGTKKGDYPLLDSFGIDSLAGSEVPTDLIQGLYLLEIASILNQDGRISSIDSLEAIQSGNSVTFNAQITAINNKNLSIS